MEELLENVARVLRSVRQNQKRDSLDHLCPPIRLVEQLAECRSVIDERPTEDTEARRLRNDFRLREAFITGSVDAAGRHHESINQYRAVPVKQNPCFRPPWPSMRPITIITSDCDRPAMSDMVTPTTSACQERQRRTDRTMDHGTQNYDSPLRRNKPATKPMNVEAVDLRSLHCQGTRRQIPSITAARRAKIPINNGIRRLAAMPTRRRQRRQESLEVCDTRYLSSRRQ